MEKKKSWFRMHPILTGVIGLFILISIIGVSTTDTTVPQDSSINTQEEKTSTQPPSNSLEDQIGDIDTVGDLEDNEFCSIQNGVAICFFGYSFNTKAENYGTLEDVSVSIINIDASAPLFPDIFITISDKDDPSTNPTEIQIELFEVIYEGEGFWKTLPVGKNIANPYNTKIFKVRAKQPYGETYSIVSFETNLSEGF